MSKIKTTKTQRGFAVGEFTDFSGIKCKIQKSSLATDDCIWLGVETRPPSIMCRDAIRLGLREVTYREAETDGVTILCLMELCNTIKCTYCGKKSKNYYRYCKSLSKQGN